MNSTLIDSVKGCLVGLACGDAVGTTVEFRPQGGFKTMTDMVGGGRLTDRYSAGNGSLMRLAPISIFYWNQPDKGLYFAGESSKTTHGADECIDSCRLFCALILSAFKRLPKQQLWEDIAYTPYTEHVKVLAQADFIHKDYEDLIGSGYVIESLESALWCFFNVDSYKEAILLAVNIGNERIPL